MLKNAAALLLALASVSSLANAGVGSALRGLTPDRRLAAAEYMAVMSGPPPVFCFIEHGYDFLGEDIANVPGATPESCCGKCPPVPGCNAYSWTDYNGGTCWLKRWSGQLAVKANVKSALFFYGGRETCGIREDVDFVGNDIGNAASATAEACCDKCRAVAGCRAFSWSSHNGGTCWFKSQRGDAVRKSGVKSADAYPTIEPIPVCAQEPNVDYVGFDIGNRPSATPSGCCKICRDMPMTTCRSWSWTNYNGGTCWLKSMKGEAVVKPGVVSAQVYENPPPCPYFEDDVDYVGNDIGNVASKDPGLCCTVCRDRMGCKAVTWSDHNGGTCWLKSAADTKATKPGVKSYVVINY